MLIIFVLFSLSLQLLSQHLFLVSTFLLTLTQTHTQTHTIQSRDTTGYSYAGSDTRTPGGMHALWLRVDKHILTPMFGGRPKPTRRDHASPKPNAKDSSRIEMSGIDVRSSQHSLYTHSSPDLDRDIEMELHELDFEFLDEAARKQRSRETNGNSPPARSAPNSPRTSVSSRRV